MGIGLFGLLFYIIPGLTIIWLAVLLTYRYWVFTRIGILFAVITVLMLGGNLIDNLFMGTEARKTGASWLSIIVALVAGIAGTIIFPPFGGLLFAAVAILIIEWIKKKDIKEGLKSTGSILRGCGFAVVARFGSV